MDVIKQIGKKQTVLFLLSSIHYNELVYKIIKQVDKKKICYVTTNKSAESLKKLYKKQKISMSNTIFIDSVLGNKNDDSDNIYYCSSPEALTELSLVISKFLEHDFEYIVFDTVTSLLIYNHKDRVAKFLSALTNKIRVHKTKAILLALDISDQSELLEESEMFVDKVVKYK